MIIKDRVLTLERPGECLKLTGMRFKKICLKGKFEFETDKELWDFTEMLRNHVVLRFYPPEEEI